MPFDCPLDWLSRWTPLIAVAAALVAFRPVALVRRRGQVGPPAPGVASLGGLLDQGRYRGVPVREEPAGPYGGGRYVASVGEIRLAEGMLARQDVDALMVLAHERAHADHDLSAPRAYRLGLVGLFLVGLALGLNGRLAPGAAAWAMALPYLVAAGHVLRNEWIASAEALRLTVGWPTALRRVAFTRLGAAYAVYLADWSLIGLVALGLAALVQCH